MNRDRTIVAFVIGTEPLATGARIVNTHNDSVHLELKPKPFRESFDIALLDTITHGGLKNYQWVNRPLALIGRVTKTDGTTVTIDIGHAPGDPVLLIADLAPHVDRDFLERRNRDVIQTEELDPMLALTPRRGDAGAQGQVQPDAPTIFCRPICRSCRRRCRSTSGSIASWSAPTATTIGRTALPRSGRSSRSRHPTQDRDRLRREQRGGELLDDRRQLGVVQDAAGGESSRRRSRPTTI